MTTEAELIHAGWDAWGVDTALKHVKWLSFNRYAVLNTPATMLYCKPHETATAMKLLG